MNLPEPPLLDPRTPADMAAAARHRLGWPGAADDPLCEALFTVFGHFCGHLLDHLNAAPQRQFEAFVDLLEPTRRPAVPAHTVLAFMPVKRLHAAVSGPRAATVAAGTPVAGPVPPGAREPVVFETTAPLMLTPARLARAFVGHPGLTHWSEAASEAPASARAGTGMGADANAGAVASSATGATATVDVPWVLAFALPDPLTPWPGAQVRLRLQIEGEPAWPAGSRIDWFVHGETGRLALVPTSDGTGGLVQSGDVVFDRLPDGPATVCAGRKARWLGCRVVTAPSPPRSDPPSAVGRQPARLVSATVRLSIDMPPMQPEAVFGGAAPLDPSRDFFPLGERPRFGDHFAVQGAAFAEPGAQVRLQVQLTNPADGTGVPPVPRVGTDHAPALRWDVVGADGWVRVEDVKDGTQGLTRGGTVAVTVPPGAAVGEYQGRRGGFLRGWLASGDYAVDPRPGSAVGGPAAALAALQLPTHHPPAMARLTLAAHLESADEPVRCIAVERALSQTLHVPDAAGVALAVGEPGEPAALYVGLRWPTAPCVDGESLQWVLSTDSVHLATHRWQYRMSAGWADATVRPLPSPDPGQAAMVVTVAGGWARWAASTVDAELFWLRLLLADDTPVPPRVWLNAVPAVQQRSARDEVLGSGSGMPGQVCALHRGGVLGDAVLEVGETGPLSASERASLVDALGPGSVRTTPASGRLPEQHWLRWQRVADFHASGPRSRHYVLDALEGRVRFGDGRRGRIPPGGPNNLVMRSYRSGGGAGGNLPPGSVTQLRSTLPYVEAVQQPLAASGGHDAETAAAARGAASAWLRHRDRAVGPDDHEDLACRAADDVARARCLPARDLTSDPLGHRPAAGFVSVALLVRDVGVAAPQPTPELAARVRSYLTARCAVDARLVVGGPLYVSVDTEVELLPLAGADPSVLADACRRRLTAFLHPVDGGPQGDGWPFGRWPSVSALRTALQGLPGLAEVRQLRRHLVEDRPGSRAAAHALPCAGRCSVAIAA